MSIEKKICELQEIRTDKHIWDEIEELFNLGRKKPHKLVEVLENEDPFQTAHPETFECPKSPYRRIDFMKEIQYPYYDGGRSGGDAPEAFRRGDEDSFIFYQHLRKAGGTGFCELAKKNMKREEIPPYYCMPDNRGSLSTPPWNEAAIFVKSSFLKATGSLQTSGMHGTVLNIYLQRCQKRCL